MRRRTANDRAPFGKQHRQLRFDVALRPRLGLVRPYESGRVAEAPVSPIVPFCARCALSCASLACRMLRCARSIHGLRSVTNRSIAFCDIRCGAEMTISAFGGLMRRYMFLMGLRTMATRMPAMLAVVSEITRLRLRCPTPLPLRPLPPLRCPYVMPALCHDTPMTRRHLTFPVIQVLFQFVVFKTQQVGPVAQVVRAHP